MLRQLLALFALIAGLSALPASAEMRAASQQGRQVEVSASEISAARAAVAATAGDIAVQSTAQHGGAGFLAPSQASGLGLSVLVGIDRAHV